MSRQNGGLYLDSQRNNGGGPGDFGTTRATLVDAAQAYGRWEARLRIKSAEATAQDFTVLVELVPARPEDYACGRRNITLAQVAAHSSTMTFGAKADTRQWTGTRTIPPNAPHGAVSDHMNSVSGKPRIAPTTLSDAACVAASEGRIGEGGPEAAAAVREYLSIIDHEVQRCTGIVDGLLDFSRPKARARALADLNGIVEDGLSLLRHHKRFRQITLEKELEPALPAVLANREQIVQVIMALTINSIDAMEAGGRLTVRTRLSRRADEVIIEVEDTGPGIPGSIQSKIFEPFFTTKAPGRGTGLGLSICYGIVEDHGGRIEVDSQLGRGSIFRVHLPADYRMAVQS